MNRIFRCIWNETTRTWVAAAETARGRRKASGAAPSASAVLLVASSLFGTAAAWAGCGDAPSGGNGIVYASDGDACNATHGTYTGTNVGFATGDGSVLTFTQPDVTINTSATAAYGLSSGGANIGGVPAVSAATVHATGNLTVNAPASSGNTRAVYIYAGSNAAGERSKLLVDGNFTATRGTGAAAVQNAGGHIEVGGRTSITTVGADAFRNTGTAATNVFRGTVSIAVTSPVGLGVGINNSGAIEFRDALSVSTTGGTAITAAAGTIDAQKGATITTTGVSAAGIALSGTAKFQTGIGTETKVSTAGLGAKGIELISTPAQGVTLALGGPLTIETQGQGAHGVYALENPAGGLTVPVGANILVKGDQASGIYQAVEKMLIERARVVDFEETDRPNWPAQRLERPFRPVCRPFCPFRAHVSHGSRMMRVPPAAQTAHAHQVVGGKAQQRLARELGLTDQFGLGQTTHCLDPAKGLLDALAHFEAGLVALVAPDAAIDRRVLVLGRHVWRDFELSAALDEGLAVVTFVGPDRGPLVLVSRRLSIASAASRSAVPLACVISTSTISPLRFSMRMCPMWHRRDLSPALFLNSRASASVVLAWVSLQRSCPLKFTSGLRPGGVPLSSSLRLKLLCEAQASISVPSTLKCSSLASRPHWALSLTRSKKARARSSLKRRSRLALKVEWSQTLSSMFRPTNQRYSRL